MKGDECPLWHSAGTVERWRQVLEVLLTSHKPDGAYEIMDRAAAAVGLTPKAPVIEITGVCAHCRETYP